MSFLDSEKTDIRRWAGYSAYGSAATTYAGYRYSTAYGALEFKMNNLSASEEAVVRTTYLTNLLTLETAIVGASTNLDTESASVWKHNQREVADRSALFDLWRNNLCGFLGVPPGPDLQSGMSMVV